MPTPLTLAICAMAIAFFASVVLFVPGKQSNKQKLMLGVLLAVSGVASILLTMSPTVAQAGDVDALMIKALGTTDNIGPVLAESFRRSALDLTAEQRVLALQCWKDSVCETGHGDITVALADGFTRRWNSQKF